MLEFVSLNKELLSPDTLLALARGRMPHVVLKDHRPYFFNSIQSLYISSGLVRKKNEVRERMIWIEMKQKSRELSIYSATAQMNCLQLMKLESLMFN